jgi:ABC-type hemin transport system substrate-binding protein
LSASAWYVANPDLTVVEARRLQKVGKALDEFLDRIG